MWLDIAETISNPSKPEIKKNKKNYTIETHMPEDYENYD